MKYLVVLLVVGVVVWMMLSRHRRSIGSGKPGAPRRGEAESMVACAHCNVNLPRSDAVFDGSRPYCSEAHRLAGPRER